MKMPIDKEWFEKRAAAEGDLEISAGGNRKTMTINLTDDELAQLERLVNPEAARLRRMVERRDEFIIANGLWDAFKEASREVE